MSGDSDSNKLSQPSGFNQLVEGRDGLVLYNQNDQYIGASMQSYGEFSHLEMEIFQQVVQVGHYVVELGANIGAHTLGFSNLVGAQGKVFAYEPQRVVFQNLCANMAINSRTNVYCYQLAAGAEQGSLQLPVLDYSQPLNFGGVGQDMQLPDANRVDELDQVEVVVLDQQLESLARLDFIKADVEGAELSVLQGAEQLIKRFQPVLYVENDRLEKSKPLIDYIRQLGYRLYWHIPMMYNPNNYAGNKQNLFGNTASFNMLCLPNNHTGTIDGFTEILENQSHPLEQAN